MSVNLVKLAPVKSGVVGVITLQGVSSLNQPVTQIGIALTSQVLRARIFGNKMDRQDGKERETKETRAGSLFLLRRTIATSVTAKVSMKLTVNRVVH
jgi:hypothetical protein